jgi:nitrite reductase/ring-hydroxylating ferredoxin subunit
MSNPARPTSGAPLIALDELKKHSATVLDFREGDALFSLIVARGEDDVYGYENVCPHTGAPLERPDGCVVMQQNKFLICAMHGASFHIKDGVCAGGPALGMALTPAPLVVEGGVVRLAG